MKTLNDILRKGKIGIVGTGLLATLNFGGCAAIQNMSDAELLSAVGAGLMVGSNTRDGAIAGAVAKTMGDNQVDKEVAREGKTEVTTNVNYNTPKEQPKNVDYADPKLISFNVYRELNNDGRTTKDELFGFGKTTFNLDKENLSIGFSNRDYVGKVIFRSWTSTGDLIGETEHLMPNAYSLCKGSTEESKSTGNFLDKLKNADPGDYRITATETGTGKNYVLDIKLISDKQ
jgi:hypothetical protein